MYMYTQLKELIQGKGNTLPKDWSPNAIRAIVIGSQFIFVAYHTKQPRYVMLDAQSVMQDLQNNGASGSLGNYLKQKQFSCLEEIYVDSIFQTYSGVMDLPVYVSTLINSRSRLRFWGYCQGMDVNELLDRYSTAQINQLSDYAYAYDSTRCSTLQYETVENPDWFSKYNLRPDKYSSDAPNGALSVYFRRIEKQINDAAIEEMNRAAAEGIGSAIVQLYNQDLQRCNYLAMLLTLAQVLKSVNDSSAMVKDVKLLLQRVHQSIEPIKMDMGTFKGYLTAKTQFNKNLVNFYQGYCKIFEGGATNLDLKELVGRVKSFDGISGMAKALQSELIRLVGSANKAKNDTYLMLFVVFTELGYDVRNGDISGVIKNIGTEPSCVENYVRIILGLCGYTENSLLVAKRRVVG